MTYFVHGTTGAQGAPVLSALRRAGHDAIGIARYPGPHGKKADFADCASLVEIYRDAEGVFIHLPIGSPDQQLVYASSIAEAISRAEPARVVLSTSGQVVDDTSSPLNSPPDSPIVTLIHAIEKTGTPLAIVAPRLFLENLLLPAVVDAMCEESVLRYPLPADFPVSWSSHHDVATVAVRLLVDSNVTGIVGVGHSPGLTGIDLAEGFRTALERNITYEPIDPIQFGNLMAPLFGDEAATSVTNLYQSLTTGTSHAIDSATSAQKHLDMWPRSLSEWITQNRAVFQRPNP